jgi:hypothetical protein
VISKIEKKIETRTSGNFYFYFISTTKKLDIQWTLEKIVLSASDIHKKREKKNNKKLLKDDAKTSSTRRRTRPDIIKRSSTIAATRSFIRW